MTVVSFPGEIIRRFLERLDASPHFSAYLRALAYCARKELDPSSLHHWWQANASRIEADDLELDFVAFLNTIVVSELTWEEAKERHQQSMQRTAPAEEGSIEHTIATISFEIDEGLKRRSRFLEENPDYRCVESAERWHQVFEQLFANNDPLKIIARWCSQLLPCGLPKSLREDEYLPDWSETARFGMEDDRPAAFLIGSPEHAHLLALSAWVSERLGNSHLRTVLDWSLNNEWMDSPPASVFRAACQCSHALFVHLMLHKEVQPADPDALICLLELPLALSASASGPPHLLPDFGFLGAGMDPDSPTFYMERAVGRKDLTAAWRRFFAAYQRLRLRRHAGRGFPRGDKLFHIALKLFNGDDMCWMDKDDADCITRCIRDMQPDVTCLLDYFLEKFINNAYRWEVDATAADSAHVCAFPQTNAFVPVVAALRLESLHELASALLSFDLVVTACGAKGNLDEMTGLDAALIASRGLPGYRLIETTLQFICSLAEQNGHTLTRMKFEQFLIPTDQRVLELITGGECEICEFKSTLRTNLHTGKFDREIEHAALKTVAAFLNKRGGNLLIGVDDDGNVLGLEDDKFPNTDKLILHFKNRIKDTMPDALDLVRFSIVSADGRKVLLVECERGRQPIYLKNRDTKEKEDEFYVRRGPSTDRLGMREAISYIQRSYPDYDPEAFD